MADDEVAVDEPDQPEGDEESQAQEESDNGDDAAAGAVPEDDQAGE